MGINKTNAAQKDSAWNWVFLVFLLILLIRVPLAAFLKHVQTYEDEWLYYSMAQSLEEGKGFPVLYHGIFHYERILYSLLISPAFFAVNRSIQFILIDLINTLCQASGVFPVYLLAKDILEDKKTAVACALIYALLPDQAMNITFMCDPLFVVLSLWVFYFGEKILEWENLGVRERILYLVGFSGFWIAASYTKKAGVVYGVILLGVAFLKSIIRGIINKKVNWPLLLLFPIAIAAAVLLYRGNNPVTLALRNYVNYTLNRAKLNRAAFLKEYVYNLLNFLAAIGFFPLVLPYIYFDKLPQKAKYFTVYMTGCIGIFSFGAAQASYDGSIHTAHLRFVGMYWLPFLILFLLAVKERGSNRIPTPISTQSGAGLSAKEEKLSLWEKIGWGFFCMGSALFVLIYHGVEITEFGVPFASAEYTMLCWAEKWNIYENYFAAVITTALLILAVLFFVSRKAFLLTFFCCFAALQIYNNVVITKRLRAEYQIKEADAREVLELDAFVKQNPDSTFLVLESGEDENGVKFLFSTKLSDTFLNQKNTLRVAILDLLRIQQDTEINLSETELPVWRGNTDTLFYMAQPCDYLIVPLDAALYPELSMCTEVDIGKGNYYRVYRLNDPNLLPLLYSPGSLRPGRSIFSLDTGRKHTEPGFLSEYLDENENAVHTSGEKSGYILFGPKSRLQPGSYTVTLYLSNTEYPDEMVIGFTELSSSNMDLHYTMRDFHQGTASVSYQLNLTEPCEGFETQVYAWVPGVTVEKLVIDYTPSETEIDS